MNLEDTKDEELKNFLLTCDGKGKEFKEAVLNELISRATEKGRENGRFEQSYYN